MIDKLTKIICFNRYCPKCKCNRSARKTYKLWSLPSIAIIQLKRFGFDHNYCLRKITTEVNFPINCLDLSPYCCQNNLKTTYSLYSVVNHIGSLSNGHYTSFVKSTKSSKGIVIIDLFIIF